MKKSRLSYPLIMLFFVQAFAAYSSERLSVISPHRKSIQREFVPAFEAWYQKKFGVKINVEWIDQGGTENDLRYIKNKFLVNPESSGMDVFWGGGDLSYEDLDQAGLLQPVKLSDQLSKEIPESVAGVRTISENQNWYATAMSSFGIFYNKYLLKALKLPEPADWKSLGRSEYLGYVSVADPRHSSSSLTMFLTMLYSEPWDEGWKTIATMSGNAREFTLSSSEPIKDVVSGDAALATAIDFYALAKIASLGKSKLGFVLPEGKTVFNADPIALLKGAPHKLAGQRFIEFILSREAQKLLILPKGAAGGPKWATLGRMSVNKSAWKEVRSEDLISPNPFNMSAPKFTLDYKAMAQVKTVLKDIIGAVYIDLHKPLNGAWGVVRQKGAKKELRDLYFTPPVSEKDLKRFAQNWHDQSFRNRALNTLLDEARKRYQKIASQPVAGL